MPGFERMAYDLAAAIFATASAAATTVSTATTAVVTASTTATEFAARATESAATTAAWRAVFAGTGLIDSQGTTVKFLAVKLIDCRLSFLVGGHGYEGESARAACEFVLHQHDFGYRATLREQVLNGNLGRVERQVADIEFVTHGFTFL